jgi:hypothetical protein
MRQIWLGQLSLLQERARCGGSGPHVLAAKKEASARGYIFTTPWGNRFLGGSIKLSRSSIKNLIVDREKFERREIYISAGL